MASPSGWSSWADPGLQFYRTAVWFVDQVGRPNVGIAVDALHLVRTGGTPADVAALEPRYFAYAQMCDGFGLDISDDYLAEAADRAMPGDGDFPLLEIVEALRGACPIDVEVPSARRAALGVPAIVRAREAADRVRALLDQCCARR